MNGMQQYNELISKYTQHTNPSAYTQSSDEAIAVRDCMTVTPLFHYHYFIIIIIIIISLTLSL
jgi:hypothetical protein